MEAPSSEQASRIIAAALALTVEGRKAELQEIAAKAQMSRQIVKSALEKRLDAVDDEAIVLTPALRLTLALSVSETQGLATVAKYLTWQEFEKFGEECLVQSGFSAQRNVKAKGGGRSWQIDIVGSKGPLTLCIDCKHWKPPYHTSRFVAAATHQRKAANYLAKSQSAPPDTSPRPVALPIILTLHEPPKRIYRGNVLLSIEKLPEFLDRVTPLSPQLPFVKAGGRLGENPMRQAQTETPRLE